MRAVSWGYKANKITFRLRRSVLEQSVLLMQSTASEPNVQNIDLQVESRKEEFGWIKDVDEPTGATRMNNMLRIVYDLIITDDLAKPLKLLGFRVDDGLIRELQ